MKANENKSFGRIAKNKIDGTKIAMIEFYIEDEDDDFLYFLETNMRTVKSNLENKKGGLWDYVNSGERTYK